MEALCIDIAEQLLRRRGKCFSLDSSLSLCLFFQTEIKLISTSSLLSTFSFFSCATSWPNRCITALAAGIAACISGIQFNSNSYRRVSPRIDQLAFTNTDGLEEFQTFNIEIMFLNFAQRPSYTLLWNGNPLIAAKSNT